MPVGSVEFIVPALTDANGNTTLSKKLSATVVADTTVTVSAVQNASSQKSIKVTYNLDMQNDSSTGGVLVASSYSIVKADGTTVIPTGVTYASKVATLTLAADLPVGTATINMTGLKTAVGDAAGALSTTVAITYG